MVGDERHFDPTMREQVQEIVVTGRRLIKHARALNRYRQNCAQYFSDLPAYYLRVTLKSLGLIDKTLPPRVPKYGCGCFERGTLVQTPHGMVPIETIKVGDLVLAVNEATGEIAPKPVTDLIRPEPKPLYKLNTLDVGGEAETFHATNDHPWKVEGKGWVETVDLKPGDRIDTGSGQDLVITSLALTDRVERTYNVTVADWHTFMVGEDQAVVHNADCFKIGSKIARQMGTRGWSKADIAAARANPALTVRTQDTRHLPGGGRMNDPATAYYSQSGGYVVINDLTGDVVLVSRRDLTGWDTPW